MDKTAVLEGAIAPQDEQGRQLIMTALKGDWFAKLLRLAGLLIHLFMAPFAVAHEFQPRPHVAAVQLIRVGPDRDIKSLAAAAKIAKNGAVIEVDAGDYLADVAVWTADDLTLRAVGGRVRLIANGVSAEGKAIWVVRAWNFLAHGFDFTGASVPDQNGAGIRFERGSMTVQNCSFLHNETGILTGNDPQSRLRIEASEFGFNGYGDGQSHNLYVGRIAHFHIIGSYLHHARAGHLLKSRATVNQVLYNRITDEPGGTASYELEFPNGGDVLVMGNIIQQSESTSNSTMLSFGAEKYTHPTNSLQLVHNTFSSSRSGGQFVRVYPGAAAVHAANNIFSGKLWWSPDEALDRNSNFFAGNEEFLRPGKQNYHLSPISKLRTSPKPSLVNIPVPTHEYLHPRQIQELTTPITRSGALQTQNPIGR